MSFKMFTNDTPKRLKYFLRNTKGVTEVIFRMETALLACCVW